MGGALSERYGGRERERGKDGGREGEREEKGGRERGLLDFKLAGFHPGVVPGAFQSSGAPGISLVEPIGSLFTGARSVAAQLSAFNFASSITRARIKSS